MTKMEDVVNGILDEITEGMGVSFLVEGERGGDPGHPLGAQVYQQFRNPDDGRIVQVTVQEIPG